MTDSGHPVDWTAQKVEDFWDHLSENPAVQGLYFSKMVGASVLRHVRRSGVRLRGRVLDFGCGPGYLMEELLRRDIPCEGVDFSADSVGAANKRLEPFEKFRGVRHVDILPTPLQPRSFDVVFFLETIEHLLEDDLKPTLAELARIVAPGGHIVVTTPNEEDLRASEVMCPDCGAVFHRMQHMRSFTSETLASTMSPQGFKTIVSRSVCFTQWPWADNVVSLLFRMIGRKHPNLLYVGRKDVAPVP